MVALANRSSMSGYDTTSYDQNVTDPVLAHLYLAEHLLSSRDRLAHRIGRHIILQTGYIQEGYHDITD